MLSRYIPLSIIEIGVIAGIEMGDKGTIIHHCDFVFQARKIYLLIAHRARLCILPKAMKGIHEFPEWRDRGAEVPTFVEKDD
jgi:hypothetical protein